MKLNLSCASSFQFFSNGLIINQQSSTRTIHHLGFFSHTGSYVSRSTDVSTLFLVLSFQLVNSSTSTLTPREPDSKNIQSFYVRLRIVLHEILSSTYSHSNLATRHPIPSAVLKAWSKGDHVMHAPSDQHRGNSNSTSAQSSGSHLKHKRNTLDLSDSESHSLPSPLRILDSPAKKKYRTRTVTRGPYFFLSSPCTILLIYSSNLNM